VAQEQADQLLCPQAGPAAAHFGQALGRLLKRRTAAAVVRVRFPSRRREIHDVLFSDHGKLLRRNELPGVGGREGARYC